MPDATCVAPRFSLFIFILRPNCEERWGGLGGVDGGQRAPDGIRLLLFEGRSEGKHRARAACGELQISLFRDRFHDGIPE